MATTRLNAVKTAVKNRSHYELQEKVIKAAIADSLHAGSDAEALIQLAAVPAAIALRRITGAALYAWLTVENRLVPASDAEVRFSLRPLPYAIKPSGTADPYSNLQGSGFEADVNHAGETGFVCIPINADALDVNGGAVMPLSLINGIGATLNVGKNSVDSSGYLSTSAYFDDAHMPYLELETSEETVYGSPVSLSPAGGFVDEKAAQKFSWRIKASFGNYAGELRQASAKLQWRASGSSAVTSYECGEEMSYTVPAGTFPTAADVEWRVVLTDNGGHTETSAWVNFSTVEALSSAAAVSPVNSYIDNSAETVFAWAHQIPTGTAPSGADLEYSTDGQSFLSLAHTDGTALSCIIPPNSLPSGTIYWRVRTYNSDALPGEWSEPVRAVVIAAPPAPVLRVDASPRPLISWQSAEQQAWQLEIPGVLSLPARFGFDYSYRLQQLLDDGQYAARVRVQNSLGLWSEWSSMAFDVKNAGGQPFELTAYADGPDAVLSWPADVTAELFIIYRDGVPVGKTAGRTYTDSFANGLVSYTVRALSGDSYAESSSAAVSIEIEAAAICSVEEREWLPLRFTQRSTTTQELTYTREGDFLNISGAQFPVAEVSEHASETFKLDFAFVDMLDAFRVKALRGKLVCLKLRRGETVIGPLLNLQHTLTDFYDSFELSIRRTHFEEAVSIEDG